MIRFRPLEAADFPMLLDWLQRAHVREWWDDGDDTLEKVAAHYGAADSTRRFIAQRHSLPIGYFQYWQGATGEIGCDQFLAEAADLSKGLGSECITAFLALIAAAEGPRAVLVDPDPANGRAIRCYEKCGFVHDPARSNAGIHFMVHDLRADESLPERAGNV